MPSNKTLIITSGEPAGIGPDLCLQIAQRDWPCRLAILGDRTLLEDRAKRLGLDASRATILHEPLSSPAVPGRLDTNNARYVLRLLDRAVAGCQSGEFEAMVTAPVQKSVINEAGVPFTGHTEYLAELTGAPLPVMMLVADKLRVALATIHMPLTRVSDSITTEGLLSILRVMNTDLRRMFGIGKPRILVCGLNPHAGESGHLGMEEIDTIEPAVAQARGEGIDAIGPLPADTAFTPRSLQGIDAVLAMYHDQGLPVLKYAGFGHAVNVTLGLPIIRTSVDHGTALSLAGTGQADPGSLTAAIELALTLST